MAHGNQAEDSLATPATVNTVAKSKIKITYSMVTFLLSLLLIAQNKIERLRFDSMNVFQAGEVEELIDMVGAIFKSKTLKELMKAYEVEVPRMFGFSSSTVMFEDPEKQQLYTITFGDVEDQKMQYEERLAKAPNQYERDIIEVKNFMTQMNVNSNELINFPTSNGITGEVYKRQTTIFYNNFNPMYNILYSADVDNIRAVVIKNIAVTPMIREDGSSNGAIHLFNNTRGRIGASVRGKLDGLRRFLGSMVENLEAKKLLVTQQIAIRSDERTYEPNLEEAQNCHDDNIVWWMNQTKPFDKMATELQKNERENAVLEEELQETAEQAVRIEKAKMAEMQRKQEALKKAAASKSPSKKK